MENLCSNWEQWSKKGNAVHGPQKVPCTYVLGPPTCSQISGERTCWYVVNVTCQSDVSLAVATRRINVTRDGLMKSHDGASELH